MVSVSLLNTDMRGDGIRLSSVEFTSQLNTTVTQPAEDEPVHLPITVKANGAYGTDDFRSGDSGSTRFKETRGKTECGRHYYKWRRAAHHQFSNRKRGAAQRRLPPPRCDQGSHHIHHDGCGRSCGGRGDSCDERREKRRNPRAAGAGEVRSFLETIRDAIAQ